MKTLVHFDPTGERTLGIWWVDETGSPQSRYIHEDSPEAARGRVVVFAKTNPEVSWVEWFHTLTERAPYFEVWGVYESNGRSPEELFSSIQPPLLGA